MYNDNSHIAVRCTVSTLEKTFDARIQDKVLNYERVEVVYR